MRAMNSRVGVNMRYLGAVGRQPKHLLAKMRAMNSMVGVNMRYLGAVGWQPIAFIGNNTGYEQHGWGQHEVSWGCRLATYCM